MLNSTAFRVAFILSLSLHVFAISAGGLFRGAPHVEKERAIEVAYLVPEELKDELREKIIESLPREYDLRKKELQQSQREKKAAEEGAVEAGAELAKEQYLDEKELEKLEEYIQYYELIREKIKNTVSKNYRFDEAGTVEVVFRIGRTGALKEVLVNENTSAKIRILKAAALKSIEDASPFPPFPEALKRDELAFSLAIIFTKK